MFKKCAPFTNSINKINNTQVDNAKDLDFVMPVCNLIQLVTIIQKHLAVYDNITEMSRQQL